MKEKCSICGGRDYYAGVSICDTCKYHIREYFKDDYAREDLLEGIVEYVLWNQNTRQFNYPNFIVQSHNVLNILQAVVNRIKDLSMAEED